MLHTCRTMVEFRTIQQSRRSACHASCRHARAGIISTKATVQAVLVSTCVGQVRLSFISKCLFIQAFTKGPKASPGFLIEHRCLFARFKEE